MGLKQIEFTRELFNPVYIPYLENKDRYLHLYGGGGSGKSQFAAQREIIQSFYHNQRILCIRKVARTLRNSIYQTFYDIIHEWNLQHLFEFNRTEMSILNKATFNRIILSGLDDPEKIKSIRAISRIWIEEAFELSVMDFRQLDLRLRGVQSPQITLTYNPVDETHWLRTHEATKLKTTYKDNHFLDPDYPKILEKLKEQDANYYKIYALGEWGGQPKGLIYTNWEEADEFPKDIPYCYGIDWGYSNDPTAIVKIGKYDGCIYAEEILYKTGLTNSDIYQILKGTREVIWADSAEPKSIEELSRRGLRIKPALKGKDSVVNGIQQVQQHNLRIIGKNLSKEIRSYKWMEDKSGEVINKPLSYNDHLLDALRYSITMEYGRRKPLIKYSGFVT